MIAPGFLSRQLQKQEYIFTFLMLSCHFKLDKYELQCAPRETKNNHLKIVTCMKKINPETDISTLLGQIHHYHKQIF